MQRFFLCNVATEPGETDGYRAEDFLAAYPDPGDGSIVYVLCPASEGKSRAA